MDRVPDYSKYTINELHEALNRLDRGLYPEREQSILKFLELREGQFLPEDYPTRQLLRMRKKMFKDSDTDLEMLKQLDEEIDRRQTDPNYAERGKPDYTKGRINWKMIAIALVVVGGLGGLLSQLSPPVPPDSPVVKDALFLAQRANASQRLIGDSLILEGAVTGELNVEQHGPWFQTGDATLTIPVKGDSGLGRILVEGSLKKNAWNFSRLELQLADSDSTISLLQELMQTAGMETASDDSTKQE
ncbi:MAG: cytochrome c oxidase assembly factor Coa1 family protein [Calditrichia bacterium]